MNDIANDTGAAEAAPAQETRAARGVANAARGTIYILDAKGRRHELALNMQVLAYVASETGLSTVRDLMNFTVNPVVAEIPAFICAVLRGNGIEVSEADVQRLGLGACYAFLQDLVKAMNQAMPEDDPDAPGNGAALSLAATAGA